MEGLGSWQPWHLQQGSLRSCHLRLQDIHSSRGPTYLLACDNVQTDRQLPYRRGCVFPAGVIPILSAPSVDGSSDGMLGEAILIAAKRGLVEPNDHVVCLLAVKDNLVVKIISVDGLGQGMVSSKKGRIRS